MFDLLATLATDLPDGSGFMHRVFFEGEFLGKPVALYPWKLVGYFGVLLFAGRWLPQLLASKKAKQVRMPRVFWVLSVLGSLSLLSYFIFGKTDSVGILANLFPAFVGLYNLVLDLKNGPAVD